MPELRRELRKALGLRDLVFLNLAAVIGIRWLAAAAHIGPGSITLWLAAAVLFFLPCAAAVSGLSQRFPEEGGIYIWTRNAFGDWHAFLCGWCYWLNNLFYFPSLVLSGVTMAAFIFGVDLSGNRAYALTSSIAAIAVITGLNILGLNFAKWIGNIGGFATYSAGAFFIIAGGWAWLSKGPANEMNVIPQLDWERLNFWPQIAFAFGGLELSAVLGGEIRDAATNVRRAAWIAGALICIFYIAGTAGMLALYPAEKISPVDGLTQVAAAAAPGFSNVLALLITLGVAGQVGAWMGGASRIPLVAGIDRLNPRFGTPVQSLVWQAVACSFFLLAMQLGDTLKTGYQLLVDIAVITYFIPFTYLFLTAWKFGARLSAVSGLAVTTIAIAFSFVPPDGSSPLLFEAKLIGGTALIIAVARYWFRSRA